MKDKLQEEINEKIEKGELSFEDQMKMIDMNRRHDNGYTGLIICICFFGILIVLVMAIFGIIEPK